MTTKPDSLIFDMDGTLWDNVDAYVMAWNNAIEKHGYDNIRVARNDLMQLMGKEISAIIQFYFPGNTDNDFQEKLYSEIFKQYHLLVPTMRPKIYKGVCSGLKKLSKKYRLFMLSNCEKGGIDIFMTHTRTKSLFIDYMEWGMNEMPKHYNLTLLKEKYHLNHPIYVGDTDSDSYETRIAGFPFAFAAYGFGKTQNYDLRFDSFQSLTDYFLHL